MMKGRKLTMLVPVLLVLQALPAAPALAEEQSYEIGSVACDIVDGSYLINIPVEGEDYGWVLDGSLEDGGILSIAKAQYEDEGFAVQIDPVSDGEDTVTLMHHYNAIACDQILTWDLKVEEGKITECTGGSQEIGPAEEEIDSYINGQWVEKDTQFTQMSIEKNPEQGWNVEIVSPMTQEAYLFKTTAYFDCVEDALISAEGFMILSGAGLIEASADKPIYQHVTETIDRADLPESSFDEKGKLRSGVTLRIPLSQKPYLPTNKGDNFCYVMFKRDGDIITEPYIPTHEEDIQLDADTQKYWIEIPASHPCYDDVYVGEELSYAAREFDSINFDSILIDYYVARTAATKQIEITPDQFGCNFYLEAQTLFRDTNGVDMPAEFIIPNCKIQSNFTFTMASSGDPSSFTFTMDAFPDYTRFDHSKKVFAAIQIIEDANAIDIHRGATPNGSYDATGIVEDANVHEDIWGGPRG